MLSKLHHVTFVVESIDDMANYIEQQLLSLANIAR